MNEIDKHVQLNVLDGVVVVELLDHRIVDTGHILALNVALSRIVAAHPNANLILTFDRVEFLSTTMLGVLTALAAHQRRHGRELRLAGVSRTLLTIFKMTRLDRVLALDPDVEAALSHLPQSLARSA